MRIKLDTYFKNKPIYFEIVCEYYGDVPSYLQGLIRKIGNCFPNPPSLCAIGYFLIPKFSVVSFIKNLFGIKDREIKVERIGSAIVRYFPEADALFTEAFSLEYWAVGKEWRLLTNELRPQIEEFFIAMYNPARIILYDEANKRFTVKELKKPDPDKELRCWAKPICDKEVEVWRSRYL